MSEAGKLGGGGSIAPLRLVAEREQSLLAARRTTRSRDGERLVEGQICLLMRARPLRKRAVVTNVPAKPGERNEHLARIRDDRIVRYVAPACGGAHQRLKIAGHKRQRFRAGEISVWGEVVRQHQGRCFMLSRIGAVDAAASRCDPMMRGGHPAAR